MHIPEITPEGPPTQSEYVKMHKKFSLKDFPINEKKIFIIGSSHTQSLNTTYINSKINSQCQDCKVYNLSIQSDSINKRIDVIDYIISAKPEIVFYGIAESDFTQIDSKLKVSNSILPDVKKIISTEINTEQYFELLKIPTSPKDKTWNLIRQMNKDESIHKKYRPYPDAPFLTVLKSSNQIISDRQIQIQVSNIQGLRILNEPEKNQTFKNLKQIILKFQENDIKILLFLTPYHDYLLNSQSKEYKKTFVSIKEELKKTGVKIYPRETKYNKMPIWHDPSHLTMSDKNLIQSDDFSKIILKELDNYVV